MQIFSEQYVWCCSPSHCHICAVAKSTAENFQILTLTLGNRPQGIWAYFLWISVHKGTSSRYSEPQYMLIIFFSPALHYWQKQTILICQVMAHKHKKKAAAWAHATRQAGMSNISSLSVPSSPNEEPLLSQPAVPVESDWDCGYTGGVNCLVSDSGSSDSEYESDKWWMAYQGNLGTQDAQFMVRKFSSTKYTSHWRIPETVAAAFDSYR